MAIKHCIDNKTYSQKDPILNLGVALLDDGVKLWLYERPCHTQWIADNSIKRIIWSADEVLPEYKQSNKYRAQKHPSYVRFFPTRLKPI